MTSYLAILIVDGDVGRYLIDQEWQRNTAFLGACRLANVGVNES